nr:hypothetical protein [Serratia fonticola]
MDHPLDFIPGFQQHRGSAAMGVGVTGSPAPDTDPFLTHEFFQRFKLACIADGVTINHCCGPAGGVYILHTGPAVNNLCHQRVSIFSRYRLGKCRHQRLELTRGVHRHRLMQVAYFAIAPDIGKKGDILGYFHRIGRHAVEGIGLDPHVGSVTGFAVGSGVATYLLVGIALAINELGIGVSHIDAEYPGFFKREQFTRIGVTITVGVFPDAQFRKGNILGINHPVVVAVEFLEGLKTVCRFAAVGQLRFRAEEFLARINPPVTIQVAYQQAVIGPNPARGFGKTVPCVIKINPFIYRQCLYAIAIKIQHNGGGHCGSVLGFIASVFSRTPWVIFSLQTDSQVAAIVGKDGKAIDHQGRPHEDINLARTPHVSIGRVTFLSFTACQRDAIQFNDATSITIEDVVLGVRNIRVKSCPAEESVSTSASIKRIVICVTIECINVITAVELVVTAASIQVVVTRFTVQMVIICTAIEHVFVNAAVEPVVAAVPVQDIFA